MMDKKPRAKPGPKPSGESRATIVSRAVSTHRARQMDELGLAKLQCFVKASTRDELATLKKSMGVENIGQVIDELVKQHIEKIS